MLTKFQIDTLDLVNFMHFEGAHIDFSDKLTLMTGEENSGLSSILNGVAVSLEPFVKGILKEPIHSVPLKFTHQYHHEGFSLSQNNVEDATISTELYASGHVDDKSIYWKLTSGKSTQLHKSQIQDLHSVIEFSNDKSTSLMQGDKKCVLPLIAYYPSNRPWKASRYDASYHIHRQSGYDNCLKAIFKSPLVDTWFTNLKIRDYQNQELGLATPSELLAVFDAVEAMYRTFGYLRPTTHINYSVSKGLVFSSANSAFLISIFEHAEKQFHDCLQLVTDIAVRCAVLNPNLLENVCKSTPGIVLIDDFSFMLSTEYKRDVILTLQSIFPNIQFIVASHDQNLSIPQFAHDIDKY